MAAWKSVPVFTMLRQAWSGKVQAAVPLSGNEIAFALVETDNAASVAMDIENKTERVFIVCSLRRSVEGNIGCPDPPITFTAVWLLGGRFPPKRDFPQRDFVYPDKPRRVKTFVLTLIMRWHIARAPHYRNASCFHGRCYCVWESSTSGGSCSVDISIQSTCVIHCLEQSSARRLLDYRSMSNLPAVVSIDNAPQSIDNGIRAKQMD